MMNVHLLTALLFSFSWISVSVSEFYTVEVQSGEQVTLMCTNYSSSIGHILWSRMDSRPNSTCISSMYSSDSSASFCDGFENGRFDMTSNTTTLFLQIKQVDLSDSGLYFCGANSIINNDNFNYKPLIDSATYLKVQEESVEPLPLLSVILGVLIIFLILIIIALVVKMRKLHICTYLKEEEQTPHLSENQNQASGDVNYAALNFVEPKIKRNRRPVRAQPNVVYTAVK